MDPDRRPPSFDPHAGGRCFYGVRIKAVWGGLGGVRP